MIKRGQVNLETPDQRVGACVHVLGFQVLFDGGRLLGVGTPSRKQTAYEEIDRHYDPRDL